MLKPFLDESRGGGGVLVAAGALGVALGISALPFYTLGLFVKPVAAEFGWSRATVQSGFLALMAGMLATGWAWGIAVDRFGARRVALASQAGLGLGFLLLSRVPADPAWWVAAWALLGVLGAGTSPVTWTRNVAARFSAGRGTALGLTLMGSGIAGFLAPLAITPVIASGGWRSGYVVLGLVVLLVAIPIAALFYRDAARPVGAAQATTATLPGQSLREVLASHRFWIMAVVFGAVSFGVGGLIPNLVPLLTDRGMSPAQAATYAGLAGLAVIVGRVAAGILVDRYWAPGVALGFLALPALSCLMLAGDGLPHGLATGLAAAAIGLAAGAEFDLVAFMCARYFGMRHYGLIYSLQSIALMGAAGAAPLVFAASFDASGSYDSVLMLCAFLFVAGPLLLLALGRYPDQHAPAPATA